MLTHTSTQMMLKNYDTDYWQIIAFNDYWIIKEKYTDVVRDASLLSHIATVCNERGFQKLNMLTAEQR